MEDPRAFATSLAVTLGAFAAAFLLYHRGLGGPRAAIGALAVSLAFVVVFGVSRRRLGRPRSGRPGFQESLFLGLTAAAIALLVGWFAFAR